MNEKFHLMCVQLFLIFIEMFTGIYLIMYLKTYLFLCMIWIV